MDKDLINYGIIGAVLLGIYLFWRTGADLMLNPKPQANTASCGCGG